MFTPGTKLGRYEFRSKIGAGPPKIPVGLMPRLCQFRLNLFVDPRIEAVRIGLKRLVQIVVIPARHDFTDRVAPFSFRSL